MHIQRGKYVIMKPEDYKPFFRIWAFFSLLVLGLNDKFLDCLSFFLVGGNHGVQNYCILLEALFFCSDVVAVIT